MASYVTSLHMYQPSLQLAVPHVEKWLLGLGLTVSQKYFWGGGDLCAALVF